MPSLLEGQLAKAIAKGFKGKLLKGVLRRPGVAESGGLDALGDPIAEAPATWGCEGFTDEYSDFSRAQAGIPETDLKVCIFAKSLPAGIAPERDDQVKFTNDGVVTWYQVRKRGTDPATALWTCQAFEIPDPEAEEA